MVFGSYKKGQPKFNRSKAEVNLIKNTTERLQTPKPSCCSCVALAGPLAELQR